MISLPPKTGPEAKDLATSLGQHPLHQAQLRLGEVGYAPQRGSHSPLHRSMLPLRPATAQAAHWTALQALGGLIRHLPHLLCCLTMHASVWAPSLLFGRVPSQHAPLQHLTACPREAPLICFTHPLVPPCDACLNGERVGALSLVLSDKATAGRALSQLKRIARALYSNPPVHGARIVAEVVGDEAMFNEWKQEMEAMAGRIKVGAVDARLPACSVPGCAHGQRQGRPAD